MNIFQNRDRFFGKPNFISIHGNMDEFWKLANKIKSELGDKGYYLDKRDEKCKEQKDNFVNCKESIDSKNCDMCEEDFYFDEKGKCIFNNFCLKESENKCEKCISDYYIELSLGGRSRVARLQQEAPLGECDESSK